MKKTITLNFFRNIFKIRFLELWLTKNANKYFFSKMIPNSNQYSPLTLRKFERNGVNLEVDISDYIGHYLYFGFPDKSMDTLFSLCKPGFNIIDIGTNIGWTLLNLNKLSKTGKVIGFEPDPYNRNVCLKNIRLNDDADINVLPYALGDTEAIYNMEVRNPFNRGGNRITSKIGNDTINVDVKLMDNVRELKELNHIDLVKIDVEGYELKVLKGGEQLLRKFKPILFIELHDDNLKDQGDSATDLIMFLETIGYNKIINTLDNSAIKSDSNFSNCHFDIIAK
jgi:FkbM family methyltransferase